MYRALLYDMYKSLYIRYVEDTRMIYVVYLRQKRNLTSDASRT